MNLTKADQKQIEQALGRLMKLREIVPETWRPWTEIVYSNLGWDGLSARTRTKVCRFGFEGLNKQQIEAVEKLPLGDADGGRLVLSNFKQFDLYFSVSQEWLTCFQALREQEERPKLQKRTAQIMGEPVPKKEPPEAL